MSAEPNQKKLPSLDGWRAICIFAVLAAHANLHDRLPACLVNGFTQPFMDGNLGVRVFFIISGFLITYLLLGEHEKNGRIDLGGFYARRALRILPVCAAYLAVVGLFQLFTAFHQPLISWLAALTFTVNFLPRGHMTGHLWSLSVEEQFYLLWPLALIWLLRRKNPRYFAMALLAPVLLAFIFSFVAEEKAYPAILRSCFNNYSSILNFDSIAIGCGAAILLKWHRPWLESRLAGGAKYALIGAGILLVWSPNCNDLLHLGQVNFFMRIETKVLLPGSRGGRG